MHDPPNIINEQLIKRPTSSSSSSNESEYIRSDFWFHDGNIVIIAGPAAFKVHRGQLERHSEVFSGLFSIPQPQSQELIDGCPCVVFHDSPSDVFYFLSALYDGLYFKYPRANDFPAIAAVLRLSTKYMVEQLRIRCLHRLHLDWPPTLQGWDHREASATDETGRYLPRDTCPHPILVIDLALEMGISTILPAALYDLSRYGPSKIFAGAQKPILAYDVITAGPVNDPPLPGHLTHLNGRISSSENNSGYSGIYDHGEILGGGGAGVQEITGGTGSCCSEEEGNNIILTREMLCKTLRGREASQRYIAGFIARELHNRQPSVDCLYKHNPIQPSRECLESFYYIMLNILRSVGGIACGRDADPLFTLVQATEMLSRTDFSDGQRQCGLRMCQACKVEFAKAAVKAREEVWGMLPTWFDLI